MTRWLQWAVRLICACAVVIGGLALPTAPAKAEVLLAPQQAQVVKGSWASFSFPVTSGSLYNITLRPFDGDADLYVYRGAEKIAFSIAGGTEVDQITWRADFDGEIKAWVFGLADGTGTGFEIAAERVLEGPPKRVGLQVGHWRNWEAGPPLSNNSGASGGGKTEAEVNLAIANAAAAYLRERGYEVDLLPTLIPKGYEADAVVAIHCDGASNPNRRGFFTDKPRNAGPIATALSKAIDEEYAKATGLTYVYRSTVNSSQYYGYRRVSANTPMVLIESGFLTSPADREIIVGRPDLAGLGIANGIMRVLDQ